MLLATLLVPFLAGCDSYLVQDVRVPASFATDSVVLRGHYMGTVKGTADMGKLSTLTFTPSYVSDHQCSVIATGTLGTEAVTASGTVNAGQYKILQSQMRYAAPDTELLMKRADGSMSTLACSYADNGQKVWKCALLGTDSESFLLQQTTR